MSRLGEFLRKPWAMVVATLLSAVAIYGAIEKIYGEYRNTVPELRTFASPLDFNSFPLSIKNNSGMFDLVIHNINCVLDDIKLANLPNAVIKNNVVTRPPPQPAIIRPGADPKNILCPLNVGMPIPANQITYMLVDVIFSYEVRLFGRDLRSDKKEREFTWKGGKCFWAESNDSPPETRKPQPCLGGLGWLPSICYGRTSVLSAISCISFYDQNAQQDQIPTNTTRTPH